MKHLSVNLSDQEIKDLEFLSNWDFTKSQVLQSQSCSKLKLKYSTL